MRELKARYGTLTLGYLWSILNPLFFTLILFFLFSRVVKLGIPNYPLYVLSGLLPWNFFQNGILSSLKTVSGNSHLFSKVYFPRHYVILSSVIVSLFLFLLDLIVILPFMFYYRVPFLTPRILALPLWILILVFLVLGLSLCFTVVNIYFRDFSFVLQFLFRIGFYVTPIFYSVSLVPERYKKVFFANPLVGILEGFRTILYGSGHTSLPVVLYSVFFSLASFFLGVFFFKKVIPEAVKIL